ncbi:MAG: hypothetical protein KF878_20505 [Planctomycetes bacterium]|nr:hypothetical protein [Planctomycetota bacterium]
MTDGVAPPSGRRIGRRGDAATATPAPEVLPPIEVPALVPAPPSEVALVLLPGGEPTNAMAEAAAGALGLTPYEARLRLREPLPRVATVGPAEEVLACVGVLRAAGVGVETLDAAPLLGPLRPFPAQRLRLEGDRLHVEGQRGEVVVDLRRPVLLVGGRFDFKAVLQAGFRRAEAVDMVPFGHLYAGGWADPIELVETGIEDWDFLGSARTPTRRTNFQNALALLRRFPDVTWNDALLQHSGRVKDCLHGLAGKGHFVVTGGGGNVTERSNQSGADLLSRVIYLLWRARLGDRLAAHDAALTVVSVREDTTDERLKAAFGGGPSALDLAHENVRKSVAEASAPPRPVSGRLSRSAGLIPPPDPDSPSGPPAASEPTKRPSTRLGHATAGLAGDPTRPLRPNPPDAPPVALILRGLSLQAPHACVCCLEPPGPRAVQAAASQMDWESVASTTLGIAALFLFERGWFHTRHEETVILRVAACARCYKHETSNELAWILSAGASLIGLIATLAKLGVASLKAVAFASLAWALLLVVLGLALSSLLSRRGPRCAPHRPLRLAFKGHDFKVGFGNRSYGERIAELNPELVVRRTS